MATSGTVALTPFKVRNIIDHASRRAKIPPQRLSSEALQVALELLYIQLSELASAGFPLWTKQYRVLGITPGSPDVPTPQGTLEALNTYWRIFMPYRGAATDQNGNSISTLFSGAQGADVSIAGPNPSVNVTFTGPTQIETVGVLLGSQASVTTALQVLTSVDGVTFTPQQLLPIATYATGAWVYFDLDPNPTTQYLRLQYNAVGPIALNQVLFAFAGSTNIPNGPFNIDDYYNLPDLNFQGDRVTSCYIDRTLDPPTLRIWPTPNISAFYAGTVTALLRRYIQDPGSLSNDIEMPPRWYMATMLRLATHLIKEIDESMLNPDTSGGQNAGMGGYLALQSKQQRLQILEQDATKAEAIAWAEERDKRGPLRLTPDVSCYVK